MKSSPSILVAIVAGLLFASQAFAEEESMRRVTVLDVAAPSAAEVDEALFPPDIAQHKSECAQMEKAGFRCQSAVPKSSLDTVQVTFAVNSAELSADAKVFLKSVGESLQRHQEDFKSLVIEGHADASGNETANKALSKKRADSVKNYLVGNFKLPSIETVGRGSEKLRDPANPRSEINRRIEFIIPN